MGVGASMGFFYTDFDFRYMTYNLKIMEQFLQSLEQPFGVGVFFLLGAITSFHCMGMCGPISVVVLQSQSTSLTKWIAYHGSRWMAYLWLGWILGWLHLQANILGIATYWLFAWVAVLLLFAFGKTAWLDKRLIRLQSAFRSRLQKTNPVHRAIVLGWLTPLFPCGPLYAALAASLLAPTVFESGIWMLSFAMGTSVLLFVQQWSIQKLSTTLSLPSQGYFYRWIALVTSCIILWKLLAT